MPLDDLRVRVRRYLESAIEVVVNSPHDNADPVTGQPFDGAFQTPQERRQFHIDTTRGAIEMALALDLITHAEADAYHRRLVG